MLNLTYATQCLNRRSEVHSDHVIPSFACGLRVCDCIIHQREREGERDRGHVLAQAMANVTQVSFAPCIDFS